MKENKKEKNVNKKKGISLIVLVITIIVIVILAVAVILSIADNNPISNANKAKFQNDVKSIQEELELTKAKNYADNSGKLNNAELDLEKLTSASKYKDKFVINEGELRYLASKLSSEEVEWATELGINEGGIVLADKSNGVTIGKDEENGKTYLKNDWSENGMPEGMPTDIIIPDGVEIIGDSERYYEWAFAGTDITSVIMPDTVTEVGTGLFSGCTKLKKVVLSKNLTWLTGRMFQGCTSLTSLVIPEGCKRLGNYLFTDSGLVSISLPSTLNDISLGTFAGCNNLKEIEIPDGLTDRDVGYAFMDVQNVDDEGLPNLTVKICESTVKAIWPEVQDEEDAAEKMKVGTVIFK